MNVLRKMVQEKTGYIPDKHYREALKVARDDIRAHPVDFNRKNKVEQLEYVSNIMAVYIVLLNREEVNV